MKLDQAFYVKLAEDLKKVIDSAEFTKVFVATEWVEINYAYLTIESISHYPD